jgi:hypothetical protein
MFHILKKALKILMLVTFRIDVNSHTFLSLESNGTMMQKNIPYLRPLNIRYRPTKCNRPGYLAPEIRVRLVCDPLSYGAM